MTNRFRELVPIKPGEGFVTAVMFCYIFGVLFFYYILDPLRKGLFLNNFSSGQLPYAYFLTALIAGAIAAVTFKLSDRLSAITLMTGINLAIIGTLCYFLWAMGRNFWYLPWIYFVYVKTVSVLSTAQFWLLAGYIYDGRQAKRIYSLLGVGAIVGAMAGSVVPGFLSKRLSTESMLATCITVCAILIILSQVAWKHRRPDTVKRTALEDANPKDRLRDIWPMVFGSPHLRMMAALIFLTLIASQIADWQLDDAAQRAYGKDQAGISQFFGRFNLVTNALALSVQVFLTGFVINGMGILASIVFLPACLFITSSSFFLYPHILTASLARGSDTVSRYSLNRAGIEMLYLPLPPATRARLKLFVDVFVDRAGRAVAGIVILIFASAYFPFGPRGTAAVAMGLTFLCLLACLRLGRSYVSAFRQQLARREVQLDDVAHFVSDPAAVRLLVGALGGTGERQILYALQLLQSVRGVDFSAQLLPLLHHPAPHVREEALRTLQALPENHISEAERLLDDTSDRVRLAAVGHLCSNSSAGGVVRLQAFLQDARVELRTAAARWAADNPVTGFRPTLNLVEGLCALDGSGAPSSVDARAAAAALSVRLPAYESIKILETLLEDPDTTVAAAAARAAGAAGHVKLAFNVASMLAIGRRRSAAREGLLCYGDRTVGTLGDLLSDSRVDSALRREIPWVLGRIPVQRSVDFLSGQLGSDDSMIQFRSVKALNRLRETHPKLQMPQDIIVRKIGEEIRAYYEALSMRRMLDSRKTGRPGLLSRALREDMDQRLGMTFRLLGLEHSQKDIYSAYVALKGKDPARRTVAIEFLDNVLERSLKPLVLPLLEESSEEVLLERAKELFGLEYTDRGEVLRKLQTGPDSWLKSCALYENGRGPNTMTTVERVLLLQDVELFGGVTTEQLSFIAAIAEEISAKTGAVLYREGDAPNGLFVVISGTIAVGRGQDVIERVGPNGSFGVWALFDDQPRITKAEAEEASRLLFVPREDFYDVLSDHVDITQGIFKQLVQRVRRLATIGEK